MPHRDIKEEPDVKAAVRPHEPQRRDRDTSWKARFRDPNGNPLPPDPVRIDVTTGEVVTDEPNVPW